MTKTFHRVAQGLAFVSLLALASPGDAQQRTRQGNAKPNTQNANRGNNNANRNTNVNRDVDVHVWNGNRVHAGRYAWPHGYAYGRRAVGYIMPRPLLTSAYYYSGWRTLGLAAPLSGHQWVRYGEDLLLVQIATGRVVDVRYGVFG